jgi:hypothetical protein
MVTRARFERATPSFGGWVLDLDFFAISANYRDLVPPENGLNPAE